MPATSLQLQRSRRRRAPFGAPIGGLVADEQLHNLESSAIAIFTRCAHSAQLLQRSSTSRGGAKCKAPASAGSPLSLGRRHNFSYFGHFPPIIRPTVRRSAARIKRLARSCGCGGPARTTLEVARSAFPFPPRSLATSPLDRRTVLSSSSFP